MKKVVPKLALRRETLRALANLQLERVRGGVVGTESPEACHAAAVVVVETPAG